MAVQDFASRWLWIYNHELPNMVRGANTGFSRLIYNRMKRGIWPWRWMAVWSISLVRNFGAFECTGLATGDDVPERDVSMIVGFH